jgi:hypothetical protein
VGEPELRCDGEESSEEGVGLARAGWHDLGERESEQRRGVAGGDRLGVARDSEESRQLRERESRN